MPACWCLEGSSSSMVRCWPFQRHWAATGCGGWPGLWVAGPAVGIAEMKIASRGREGSWSAVGILLTIAAVLLMMTNARLSFRTVAGIALVAWGAAIILHEGFHKRGGQPPEKEKDQKI